MQKKNDMECCEELFQKAQELLEGRDFDNALKIGSQLKKLSYSGAFEVIALAYEGLDKKKKAVGVLEEGVKKAPFSWKLWQLLGNFYSENNQFSKSFDAYEKGLKADMPNIASLNYNYALALLRADKINDAEKKANYLIHHRDTEKIDSALGLLIDSLKMSILNRQGRYKDCVNYSEKLLVSKSEKSHPSEEALILEKTAYALWKLGEIENVRLLLSKAISLDKYNRDVQWLLREMNKNKDFSNSKYYRILIHGRWPKPFEKEQVPPNFYTSYDVIADDKEEAFQYIKFFEPPEIHKSLEMKEVRILKAEKQPKGVYQTSGYSFYQPKAGRNKAKS